MSRRFAEITFTESVKEAQLHYGSREKNALWETSSSPNNELTEHEMQFIEARDSFYQATVGQNGWPYVQFRGGPAGFLKVLNNRTIGYADFKGNVQYISVGNLNADDRVALILMDYANKRRLKIWARAVVMDAAIHPDLTRSLEMPHYRARIERAVVLSIEAFDWNCPQHITPRFSMEELGETLQPLEKEILRLSEENAALRKSISQGVKNDNAL